MPVQTGQDIFLFLLTEMPGCIKILIIRCHWHIVYLPKEIVDFKLELVYYDKVKRPFGYDIVYFLLGNFVAVFLFNFFNFIRRFL